MSEANQFNFSKPEHQEKFHHLTPEERNAIVDETHSLANEVKQKMAGNEKLDYRGSHREIELEKIRESAKNGELARKLRVFDLSNEEDVEKLSILLRPWKSELRSVKILDADGNELFITKTPISTYESKVEYILDAYPKGYFQKLKNSTLEERVSHYGHEIYHSTLDYLELSSFDQDVEKGLGSSLESDKFINTIGAMANGVATSLNGGLPGAFVGLWAKKMKHGEIAEGFVSNHPNYGGIMRMSEKADAFFEALFEVFKKFLSHQIQDSTFTASGENSHITAEQIILDFRQSCEIYESINRRDREERGNEALKAALSPAVDEQTNMFTQKIEQYQKVLDEYNQRLSYAKPQVEPYNV